MAKRIKGLCEWKSNRGMKPAELRRQIATLRKVVSRFVARELVHGLEHRAAMGTIEGSTRDMIKLMQENHELRKQAERRRLELAKETTRRRQVEEKAFQLYDEYQSAGLGMLVRYIREIGQTLESRGDKTPSLGRKAQNKTLKRGRKSALERACER